MVQSVRIPTSSVLPGAVMPRQAAAAESAPQDRVEIGQVHGPEKKRTWGQRLSLANLKAHAYQLTSRVALSMAGLAGAAAPETTMMHMLSSQFLTPSLGTAARVGLFDAMPGTPKELARELKLDEEGVQRLLRACAAAGAVKIADDGTCERTRTGDLLTSDHPRSLKPLAVMLGDPAHWESWGQLEHSVRTGRPASEKALGVSNVFDHYAANPAEAGRFNEGMTAISRSVTEDLAKYYDFSEARHIIDVGGGHGFLLSAALRGAPQARGTIYDLPDVVAGADPQIAQNGMTGRIDKAGGSFFQSVPAGGDVYLMKNILHDWNDSQCVEILTNLRKAMSPDARLVVVEALVGDNPSAADFMNLHMLVMNGGKERTRQEFEHLLAHAGLKLEQVIPTAGPFHLFEARVA